MARLLLCGILVLLLGYDASSENGYELWMRYKPADVDASIAESYRKANGSIWISGEGEVFDAVKSELVRGISGLTGQRPELVSQASDGLLLVAAQRGIVAGIPDSLWNNLGDEGFRLVTMLLGKRKVNVIVANKPVGALYGAFSYLRLMQTGQGIDNLDVVDVPKISYRMLNHWDNLNGTIERGYAGYSLWNWERLPRDIDPRIVDYARANASIGINGVVINNVNAEAKSLRHDWLVRLTGLADALRPYGMRVYLTAKFSAPIEIGGFKSASPADSAVARWWCDKADEIYSLIPDFGGFLVKANSEGQPGPQDYGCTHSDGANMLARALAPHGGIVFWRAFVYHNDRTHDRVTSAWNEFMPLDGKFDANVVVQAKNGPIDFQPREPFHPLFGGMKSTSLAMEFQITQENLGHAGHLVYLGKLYEEVLQSVTDDKGTTVARVLQDCPVSAIAGVPNIGSEINRTGHPFGQANWFAFGRLCWNPDLSSESIADDWVRMTFSSDSGVVEPIKRIMAMSREAVVNYSMPLGLTHIMNFDTHNGPEPWHDDPVWTAFDYHKVTVDSIGVDRTSAGSGATLQYNMAVGRVFDSLSTCPDEYLLWFHRLPWTYKMRSGKTLWRELVDKYYTGVEQVRQMQQIWSTVEGRIDDERHARVANLLKLQEDEAIWWRDGCLLFFDQYARMGIPSDYEQPAHSLDYYKSIPFPYRWNGYYE